MKKTLALSFLALFLIASIAMVSAATVIAGKIYDSPNFETANAVGSANINVTCIGNVLYTTSLSDGTYSVTYNDTANCPDGSTVTVWAEKGGITNSGTGLVHDFTAVVPNLYLGVINIALIPEFGVFVGALTLLSAVGVFFLVRRK
jgi:hypothetical protein